MATEIITFNSIDENSNVPQNVSKQLLKESKMTRTFTSIDSDGNETREVQEFISSDGGKEGISIDVNGVDEDTGVRRLSTSSLVSDGTPTESNAKHKDTPRPKKDWYKETQSSLAEELDDTRQRSRSTEDLLSDSRRYDSSSSISSSTYSSPYRSQLSERSSYLHDDEARKRAIQQLLDSTKKFSRNASRSTTSFSSKYHLDSLVSDVMYRDLHRPYSERATSPISDRGYSTPRYSSRYSVGSYERPLSPRTISEPRASPISPTLGDSYMSSYSSPVDSDVNDVDSRARRSIYTRNYLSHNGEVLKDEENSHEEFFDRPRSPLGPTPEIDRLSKYSSTYGRMYGPNGRSEISTSRSLLEAERARIERKASGMSALRSKIAALSKSVGELSKYRDRSSHLRSYVSEHEGRPSVEVKKDLPKMDRYGMRSKRLEPRQFELEGEVYDKPDPTIPTRIRSSEPISSPVSIDPVASAPPERVTSDIHVTSPTKTSYHVTMEKTVGDEPVKLGSLSVTEYQRAAGLGIYIPEQVTLDKNRSYWVDALTAEDVDRLQKIGNWGWWKANTVEGDGTLLGIHPSEKHTGVMLATYDTGTKPQKYMWIGKEDGQESEPEHTDTHTLTRTDSNMFVDRANDGRVQLLIRVKAKDSSEPRFITVRPGPVEKAIIVRNKSLSELPSYAKYHVTNITSSEGIELKDGFVKVRLEEMTPEFREAWGNIVGVTPKEIMDQDATIDIPVSTTQTTPEPIYARPYKKRKSAQLVRAPTNNGLKEVELIAKVSRDENSRSQSTSSSSWSTTTSSNHSSVQSRGPMRVSIHSVTSRPRSPGSTSASSNHLETSETDLSPLLPPSSPDCSSSGLSSSAFSAHYPSWSPPPSPLRRSQPLDDIPEHEQESGLVTSNWEPLPLSEGSAFEAVTPAKTAETKKSKEGSKWFSKKSKETKNGSKKESKEESKRDSKKGHDQIDAVDVQLQDTPKNGLVSDVVETKKNSKKEKFKKKPLKSKSAENLVEAQRTDLTIVQSPYTEWVWSQDAKLVPNLYNAPKHNTNGNKSKKKSKKDKKSMKKASKHRKETGDPPMLRAKIRGIGSPVSGSFQRTISESGIDNLREEVDWNQKSYAMSQKTMSEFSSSMEDLTHDNFILRKRPDSSEMRSVTVNHAKATRVLSQP
ncbi:uncharacterized protein LOC116603738 [Nematostella vectensis]|uniref:uncharacterized protein LOC116603738 n=1 Tax=Nematostella vectensis TaxID=45351 RepID=UPI0020778915|nr:uncharacterized protein LOC116603738 [Nematostella vectensis]